MGEDSKIEWTDHTFNPWIGCAKVSEACKHCYAEVNTFARRSRAHGLELWGADAHRHITSEATWAKPERWNAEAKAAGVRRRTFCASLADVFESRPDLVDPRRRLFALIERCTWLDWQLLTKRPENIMEMVPNHWRHEFPPNVWAGTTAETQERADERLHWLCAVPASVLYVSVEPMLGELDLRPYFRPEAIGMALEHHRRTGHDCSGSGATACCDVCRIEWTNGRGLSWVIAGGESGRSNRPLDLKALRSLSAQCWSWSVPFFMKQLGAGVRLHTDHGRGHHHYDSDRSEVVVTQHPKGGDPSEWPEDLRVREFPKGAKA